MRCPPGRVSSVLRAADCSPVPPCNQGVAPADCPCNVHTSGEDLSACAGRFPRGQSNPHLCCPRFCRYRSMLFGLPLAVLACNRLPMLMQAIVRWLFCIMVSLCFDDFAQQDLADLATRARDIVGHVFSICGFPLAPENHQSPSATGDSPGLLPDVSSLRSTGRIRLWVRQHLVDKIQDIVNTPLSTGSLTPGQASKLFGCLTCLDHGLLAVLPDLVWIQSKSASAPGAMCLSHPNFIRCSTRC